MKVMIVDDNPQMRSMIKSVLTKTAHSFHECSDGGEAVKAFPLFRPDWTLMDIKMKEIDGLLATEAIKHSFPDAKVIIVTQYDDPDLRAKAKRAGAVAYVLKENLMELQGIIQRTPPTPLGGSSTPDQLRKTGMME